MHLIIIWKRFPWLCTTRLVEGNTNATKTGLWKAPSALWKAYSLPIKEGNGLCPREDIIGFVRFITMVVWVTWESSGGRPSSLLTRSASVWPGPPAPGEGWITGKQSHPASETTQKNKHGHQDAVWQTVGWWTNAFRAHCYPVAIMGCEFWIAHHDLTGNVPNFPVSAIFHSIAWREAFSLDEKIKKEQNHK